MIVVYPINSSFILFPFFALEAKWHDKPFLCSTRVFPRIDRSVFPLFASLVFRFRLTFQNVDFPFEEIWSKFAVLSICSHACTVLHGVRAADPEPLSVIGKGSSSQLSRVAFSFSPVLGFFLTQAVASPSFFSGPATALARKKSVLSL